MAESIQHKLDRVRPPRVQITYDVEIGDAIEMKELPFVAGIMSDLSGDISPENPLPKVKDRKFVSIDRDNFNDVLAAIGPRLAYRVENKLENDGSNLNIKLNFNDLSDFDPINVVKQVDALKELYEARQLLSELVTKLDGNDALDELLQGVLKQTEKQKQLKQLIGAKDEADAPKLEGKEPETPAAPEEDASEE